MIFNPIQHQTKDQFYMLLQDLLKVMGYDKIVTSQNNKRLSVNPSKYIGYHGSDVVYRACSADTSS